MPTLIHRSIEEGEFGALIQKAETGDVIDVCNIKSDKLDYHPASLGVMELTEHGFLLNGEELCAYTKPCRNWAPYQGTNILIFNDDSISFLSNSVVRVVHQNGPLKSFDLHVPTETVIIGEENFKSYLFTEEYKQRKVKTVWKIPVWWTKDFATKHIRPLDVPCGTDFQNGHPEGPVFFIGSEFVLVKPGKRTVLHKGKRPLYRNWIACAKGIVDLNDTTEGLAFNEDLVKPFYHGRFDHVVPTPSGCVIAYQGQFFLPFEEKPFAFLPYDDVCQHRYGVLVVKDKKCSILVVK